MRLNLLYTIGGRDTPVEELVAVRAVTPMRESSSLGLYIGRRSHRDVVMFLYGEAMMIPIRGGGHYYMPTGRFQQMHTEHFYEMFLWYLDQFNEDPTEQRAIRTHVQARGYRGSPTVAVEPIEEDTKEDP
ncbi:hypothetical protein FNV43_RR19085 [Rhamnella rubrinervis]|uniref:Uncharacterized protein n=1 Tax=Rhamnella rubrinervis TaxID=2594499 RepID=A0A8K0GW72_9ROSA|nr:hypothetical protein FNV43_RR19085 [Rhamnella rubrinervis]